MPAKILKDGIIGWLVLDYILLRWYELNYELQYIRRKPRSWIRRRKTESDLSMRE